MPPVLDPSKSKVDGLAFLGLSLSRYSDLGHPASATHQNNFDLNEVLDRDYEFLFSTNDDGWLVGGGEPGPPKTYKLAAKDSAHVEIMRIGTYRKDWGGVPQEELVEVMKSGQILIPQIEVLPTAVVANPDKPPELEIRFDMEPQIPDFDDDEAPLPTNWQLRFLHNQLFKRFIFPSRFCPGAFHSTILRKAEFRSEEHRAKYFAKCEAAIAAWREIGPQPLNEVKRDLKGNVVPSPPKEEPENHPEAPVPEERVESPKSLDRSKAQPPKPEHPLPKKGGTPLSSPKEAALDCNSGIWLFTDRENITHFFEPNFLPPYDTPEKRKIILDILREEWDEETLSWKPCGEGSMTKKELLVQQEPTARTAEASVSVDEPMIEVPQLKELVVTEMEQSTEDTVVPVEIAPPAVPETTDEEMEKGEGQLEVPAEESTKREEEVSATVESVDVDTTTPTEEVVTLDKAEKDEVSKPVEEETVVETVDIETVGPAEEVSPKVTEELATDLPAVTPTEDIAPEGTSIENSAVEEDVVAKSTGAVKDAEDDIVEGLPADCTEPTEDVTKETPLVEAGVKPRDVELYEEEKKVDDPVVGVSGTEEVKGEPVLEDGNEPSSKTNQLVEKLDTFVGEVLSQAQVACCTSFLSVPGMSSTTKTSL